MRSSIKEGFTSNIRWITSILISLCLAIVVIFVVFISQIQKTLEQDTGIYLQEVTSHIARLINTRIKDDIRTFESLMLTYQDLENSRSDLDGLDADEFLDSKKDLYDFSHISFVDEDGSVFDNEGLKSSYRDIGAYQRALNGDISLSWTGNSPYDGKEAIVYAMPLDYHGRKRVIIAEKSTQDLVDSLSLESFNGFGSSFIIDRSGRFALKSANVELPADYSSYYEILYKSELNADLNAESIIRQVEEGKTGAFSYQIGESEYFATFMPLTTFEWTLFSIVSSDVVMAKTNLVIGSAFLVGLVTVFLFLILVVLLLHQQRKNQQNIENVLFVDPLTNGKSRTRFELDVKQKIANRNGGSYAVISMNVDKFKLINELYSIEDGNRALNHIYQVILNNLDEDEELSRYDADSFVILMRVNGRDGLSQRLNSISLQINSFNDDLEFKYYLTMSVGIYIIEDSSMDFAMILDRAITARKSEEEHHFQYLSYAFYNEDSHMKLHQEKQIANLMYSGIKNHEFVIYLQPKVDLQSNRIVGAEALVRWCSSVMGFTPPNQFIPIFEKNGFILRLDIYIFEEVCSTLRRWLDKGMEVVPISVNMSLLHLQKQDFLDEYIHIMKKYQIPPHYLELELTETIEAENLRTLQKVIEQLHDAGFDYALDDFGSGYSSLNMLKDISVDTLKLDRAFFDKSFGEGEERSESVVRSVVELAKQLRIKTVAEGVESLKQLELLRRFGCDQVQGYVFSKPLPLPEFEDLLVKNRKSVMCHDEDK